MLDFKKYNMGTYFAIGLSFLNIIFYFMPFIYSKLVESQLSGYQLLLLMFDPVNATGVGASLFNDYTQAGVAFNPLAYIISILAFVFLCISVAIIIYCFLDLMGYRANKKLVTYLSYTLLLILMLIIILVFIRSELFVSASKGIAIGYGLIMALISSIFLNVLRFLKIQ